MAKGKDKLTEIAIKKAKPKEKNYKLFDGGGLYLDVTPSGGKYWRMKYHFARKEKCLAFGTYPVITLSIARNKAIDARRLLVDGIDPGDLKRQEKLAKRSSAENTFQGVAQEWYDKERPHWSESHAVRVTRFLEKYLFPYIGHRPIKEITPPEILAVLRRVENRGAIETAHRVKQTASAVLRYAVATGRAERDNTQDLRGALASPKKTNFAAITEPKDVGTLMRDIDRYHGTPVVKAAFQLSPLLFQRPGEIRQMRWAEINFETCEWRYQVTKKNIPHIVPLSRQAIVILKEIQLLTGRGMYVFPSARGASRSMSDAAVRMALRTLGYDKETMSAHGFRAMARTILEEVLGIPEAVIERQLSHKVKDGNEGAYNRTKYLPQRKEMMQKWADYLDDLRSVAAGENVVEFTSKSREKNNDKK